MKNYAKKMKAFMAMLLTLALLFTLASCGNEKATSEELNYGNEEDVDYGDDDDETTITTTKTESGSKQIVEYDNGLEQKYGVDENKKAGFLESVPKSLSGTTVNILVWWKTFEYEKKKMEAFSKATGIKVNFIYADSANYLQKLAALKAQGKAPEIACITDYPASIIQDYFKPITDGKLSMDSSVFDLDSMKKFQFNGKQYGAIVKGNTHITMGVLLYNADLFSKNGVTDPNTLWKQGNWNWNTFVSTCQQIQTKSNLTAFTAEYQGYRLAQTAGEDAVNITDGKMSNNTGSQTYRNAYKWLADLTLDGQYKVFDGGLNRAGFMDGKCAMMVEDSWALQSGERYENTSFKLGYAPLPCPTNTTVVPCDAQLWGFPVGSKNTEAASYALEYWLNPVYDDSNFSMWCNTSVASFMDWLWEQPKTFRVSEGVINYGGDYNWFDYNFDLVSRGLSNVDSYMDKWSKVIDANLKRIMTD